MNHEIWEAVMFDPAKGPPRDLRVVRDDDLLGQP